MPELNDHELLAEFAETNSETAFAALVERYVNLVHSTALRFTYHPHHAEEITQAVFIILARKAGKLSPRVVLSGWLYQAARLTAANLVKAEMRRHHREQEAFMQTILNEPDPMTWKQIAPLLDEAMGGLGETDRNAVVLRFFENKTAAEAAVELKLTEAATHKRVNRALEKLRKFFTKRGVSSTTAIIAGTISVNSVQAAPVALAKSVTAAAIAKGAAASASTLALIKGALKIMAWTKMKTAVAVGVGVLLAASTTTVVLKEMSGPKITDSMWELSNRNITNLPPMLILRKTQFAQGGGLGYNGKFIAHGFEVQQLLDQVYGYFPRARERYLTAPPKGRFDMILTLTNHPKEALAQEIKTKFGLVARTNMVATDALLLQPIETGVRNIKPGMVLDEGSSTQVNADDTAFTSVNMGINELQDLLEGMLEMPVVDRTQLAARYNYSLSWNALPTDPKRKSAVKQALLNQLGLELVPTNIPVEMLIVERAH